MATFLRLMLIGTIVLLSSIGSYISARIVFPDMGLGVPSFGKFFAAACVIGAASFLIGIVKAFLMDDLR